MSIASSLPSPNRVLADLLPSGLRSTAVVVPLGAAVVGLLAQVNWQVPGWPVPFTGQTLGVLVVAAALGSARAGLSMLLYGGAGIAGVPWLAGGAHGFPTVTFGYIVGFIAAALLVGRLAERGWTRSVAGTVAAMTLGTLTVYACGVPWLMGALHLGLGAGLKAGMTPFVLPDLVKVVLAAAMLPAASRSLRSKPRR